MKCSNLFPLYFIKSIITLV